jgi:hypothetical protein
MGELPRNVREFIVRDLIYIVGGGMVLASFLYRFDRLPDKDTPLAFYLLGAGIAYVVGNALQDIVSIFRLVTTAPVLKLGRPWRWIYRQFTNEDWKDINTFDRVQTQRAVRSLRKKDQGYAAGYERLISGVILAATMAPCTFVSSLLVWSRWWAWRNRFDLWLGGFSLILSLGVFVLARMRAAQMARADAEAAEEGRATSEPAGPESDA